jgi:hypothetical protein
VSLEALVAWTVVDRLGALPGQTSQNRERMTPQLSQITKL